MKAAGSYVSLLLLKLSQHATPTGFNKSNDVSLLNIEAKTK